MPENDKGASERPRRLYFTAELDDEAQTMIEDHNRHVRRSGQGRKTNMSAVVRAALRRYIADVKEGKVNIE